MTVQRVAEVTAYESWGYKTAPSESQTNDIYVYAELDYLNQTFPMLNDFDFIINISNYDCIKNGEIPIGGFTVRDENQIFIFNSLKPEQYTTSHEIGHIVRFNKVSMDELKEYFWLRTNSKDFELIHGEEIFAEDFRILFGSDEVRKFAHERLATSPGNKEWQWFANKFELTWEDSLKFFTRNPSAGSEELQRAAAILEQDNAAGDRNKSKITSNWIISVRLAMMDGIEKLLNNMNSNNSHRLSTKIGLQ